MSKCETPEDAGTASASKIVTSPGRLVVESPKKDIPQDALPFKLCHGATHRLELSTPDGSSWAGQKLCVLWMAGNSEEAGTFFSEMDPPLKPEDGVDDEGQYQVLSEEGPKWTLTAKAGADVVSGEMKLGLGSYWQARKHEFLAQMGDFHYEITQVEWDNVIPIKEEGRCTTLTAIVENVFDKTRAIGGATVEWWLNGKLYQSTATDEQGESKLIYLPEEEEIINDEVNFEVKCVDGLLQESKQPLKLSAFVKTPWADQLKLELREMDGTPVPATPLGMRLVRGGNYRLHLIPTEKEKKDNFFIGKSITLGWPVRKDQLGIEFHPKAAQTMPEEGLSWDIKGGGQSGKFTLTANADGLGLPYLLFGVQMSQKLGDEADLVVVRTGEEERPVFQAGVEKTVRIVPTTGSPLGELGLAATLRFVQLDDWLSADYLHADPAYERPSDAVTEAGVTWTIKPNNQRGKFGLKIEMPGFKTPLELPAALLMSSHLGNEVQVEVDGTVVGNSRLISRRDKPLKIKLVPKADKSPLKDTKLKAWISFTKSGALDPQDVVSEPLYDKKEPANGEDGLSWTLTGAKNKSGMYTLALHVESFLAPIELKDALLISELLSDEADVLFDDDDEEEEVLSPVILRRNSPRKIKLKPKTGSPLNETVYKCWMTFTKGTLEPGSVEAVPRFNEEKPMEPGGLSWELKGLDFSGTCTLDFHVSIFKTTLKLASVILLSQNLEDEADLVDANDGTPLSPYFWIGESRRVSLKPKTGSPLALAGLSATLRFVELEENLKQASLPADPPYDEGCDLAPETDVTWRIDPANARGQFGLSVEVTDFSSSLELKQAFLMSTVLSDEADVFIDGMKVDSTSIIMFRQKASTIELRPRVDIRSPLGQTALKGQLTFIAGSLSENQVPVTPPFKEEKSMTVDGLKWTRTEGNSTSGTFALGVEVEDFKTQIKTPEVTLISDQLEDELSIYFDHKLHPSPLVKITDKHAFFQVYPKPGSPLFDKDYQCSMLEVESRVHVNPIYGCARRLTSSSGLGWTMFSMVTVEFSVKLEIGPPLDSMSYVVARPDKPKK